MNTSLAVPYSSGYLLSLSDGSSWWIAADEDSVCWVDELAAIMQLKKCEPNGSPKIIFSKMAAEVDEKNTTDETSHIESRLWKRDDPGWTVYAANTIRIWFHNTIPDIICEVKSTDSHEIKYITMWNAIHPIYQRSLSNGGLPFHASFAELEGKGVLFAAPGDTGKTTCCRRLPDYWNPLSDDEVLVVPNGQKEYRAHPFPTWSDYLWKRSSNTWDVQYSVPLAAVFFLEQGETDEVIPLGAGEAAVHISESANQVYQKYWRSSSPEEKRKSRQQIFDNACEITKRVPTFRLRATLHGRFWEEVENALA